MLEQFDPTPPRDGQAATIREVGRVPKAYVLSSAVFAASGGAAAVATQEPLAAAASAIPGVISGLFGIYTARLAKIAAAERNTHEQNLADKDLQRDLAEKDLQRDLAEKDLQKDLAEKDLRRDLAARDAETRVKVAEIQAAGHRTPPAFPPQAVSFPTRDTQLPGNPPLSANYRPTPAPPNDPIDDR